MRCQRTLPATLFSYVVLLVTLPAFGYFQTAYSQADIFRKKSLLYPGQARPEPFKLTTNFPQEAARLPVSGYVSELGISPREEVWMATKAGNTYYTKAIGGLWHFGPFGSKDPYASNSGESYERVSFFTEDTMMISGFIQGEKSVADFVYWSGDHGRNWRKIKFGESSWIDAAYINQKGKAWMSGSSQFIYYSRDNGLTWEQKSKVEPTGNLRFQTIHFADDEKTGLFGSGWNVIYKTTDNCNTWEKLPTPLTQGKYTRLSSQDRPDIRKIRILGNRYLVNQQGRVFWTSAEKIDWQPLPAILDFEVKENGSVYLIHRDLTISLMDAGMITKWKSAERLGNSPEAIAVRNNNLFVYCNDLIYKIDKEEIKGAGLFTTEVPIEAPDLEVKYKGDKVGFSRQDVLGWDRKKDQWYRTQTLPFSVGTATIFDGQLVLADYALETRYILDLESRSLKKHELPASLFNVPGNAVKSFTMEQGSQGCYHLENNTKTYLRKGDTYVLAQNRKIKDLLKNTPSRIPAQSIDQLLHTLNTAHHKPLSVADLQLTDRDIAAYKALISEREIEIKKNGIDRFASPDFYAFPGEKTDFDFYRSVAQSINMVPDSVIAEVFGTGYGNYSTTTNWIKLTLDFQDGRKLSITNKDDRPNYLYTPWVVDSDGLLLKTNSFALASQIDQLFGGNAFNPIARDKRYALFQIADYLYRQSLQQR